MWISDSQLELWSNRVSMPQFAYQCRTCVTCTGAEYVKPICQWEHGFGGGSQWVVGGVSGNIGSVEVFMRWGPALPVILAGHMSKGYLPELGAGMQPYSSYSEWEYILCSSGLLEILYLFLDYTKCDSQEIVLNVRKEFGNQYLWGCYKL